MTFRVCAYSCLLIHVLLFYTVGEKEAILFYSLAVQESYDQA